MQSDITYSTQQSQHKACHDSTLRVFSVKNNSFAFWRYGYFSRTKSSKSLSLIRRYWVFSVKRTHLQSDITYSTQQSQHKACHDSTLRVFSVKNNSFAFWRYGYFSVQSHQKACHWFDVTGFFSKKTLICNLTLHIQHNKVNIKLVTIRRYGFFQ